VSPPSKIAFKTLKALLHIHNLTGMAQSPSCLYISSSLPCTFCSNNCPNTSTVFFLSLGGFPTTIPHPLSLLSLSTPLSFTHSTSVHSLLGPPRFHHAHSGPLFGLIRFALIYVKLICNFNISLCHLLFILLSLLPKAVVGV